MHIPGWPGTRKVYHAGFQSMEFCLEMVKDKIKNAVESWSPAPWYGRAVARMHETLTIRKAEGCVSAPEPTLNRNGQEGFMNLQSIIEFSPHNSNDSILTKGLNLATSIWDSWCLCPLVDALGSTCCHCRLLVKNIPKSLNKDNSQLWNLGQETSQNSSKLSTP